MSHTKASLVQKLNFLPETLNEYIIAKKRKHHYTVKYFKHRNETKTMDIVIIYVIKY